jgi:NTE family protein
MIDQGAAGRAWLWHHKHTTRVRGAAAFGLALLASVSLSSCGTGLNNAPINLALSGEASGDAQADVDFGQTLIGLSFSGGGTRAAAFSYGVLLELARTQIVSGSRTVTLIDKVDFVSGVSGGSVTAAYFALRGVGMTSDFRTRFLLANVEASLRTNLSIENVLRASIGGVNDRSGLQEWLDENLFRKATYADISGPGKPVLWVNASDIYNRTPFVFNQSTFDAICSDLSKLPLSEAVAASAAVPLAFAPVVLKNFAPDCRIPMPEWVERTLSNPDPPALLRAQAEAIQRYRENEDVRFLKLLDGGLTDNLGLTGLVLAKLAADRPYEPLSPAQAVQVRRMLFVIVDSGRPPGGDWSRTVEGPGVDNLILAVSDTAIDANIRGAYDYFETIMARWRRELVDYRCSLTADQVAKLRGSASAWRCDELSFHIVRIAFDKMPDDAIRTQLDKIPTSFQLPEKSVDLLIQSAGTILRQDKEFRSFLRSFPSDLVITHPVPLPMN